MPYALKMLWREQARYLAAVGAVTFSAMLIAVQTGLFLGLLIYTSLPIDHTTADVWITTRDAVTVSLAYPFPDFWLTRIAAHPEVERAEIVLQGAVSWHKPRLSSAEMCMVYGSRLGPDALGKMKELPPRLCLLLAERGAVVIDESDMAKLGVKYIGDFAELNWTRVRVVGTVKGFQGVTAPYVFCSIETARQVLPIYQQRPNLIQYVLVRCKNPADAPRLVGRLREQYPDMGVYTAREFSQRTRSYWMLRSKAGTVLTCTVILAVLVGMVVTSQTLHGAAMASLREYAVLDALGISRWRLVGLVMSLSFWIGMIGILLAVPLSFVASWAATLLETNVLLPGWVILLSVSLTMAIALASGVWALRSLRKIEPALLLR